MQVEHDGIGQAVNGRAAFYPCDDFVQFSRQVYRVEYLFEQFLWAGFNSAFLQYEAQQVDQYRGVALRFLLTMRRLFFRASPRPGFQPMTALTG